MSETTKKQEIYVSVDVEADGPIPGAYSMISLGSVAYDEHGRELADFEVNLSAMQDATQDPDTMAWWKTQPEAWEYCQQNQVEPQRAMARYLFWLECIPGKKVFVGYPASYDFNFVYWYLIKFTGKSPFGFQALDMKSFAMCLLNTRFRDTTKKTMPKDWFSGQRHTHKAIDDAREQGHLFFSMRKNRDALDDQLHTM